MMVRVLFFARARDLAGVPEIALELPAGATVAGCSSILGKSYPALRAVLAAAAFSVNEEFAAPTTILSDGDIVAVIPPVSGGSGAAPAPL